MTALGTAAYLGIRQAASSAEVTLTPNLQRQFTRTLAIARIVALSTHSLEHFLHAVPNAARGLQAIHLMHPRHMLRGAVTTMRRAWAIHGHQSTSLRAEMREESAAYYGDGTDA